MEKHQILKHCRYYKGEEEAPKSLIENGTHFIWACEELWYKHQIGGKAPRRYYSPEHIDEKKTPSKIIPTERFAK